MKIKKTQKLIFIYNADSGVHNMIFDSAHKIFSPNTYECGLCNITFGVFTENRNWKKFKNETDLEMDFLHKDEFQRQYASKFGHKFTFPIILAVINENLDVLVNTNELNELENAEGLIDLINKRT